MDDVTEHETLFNYDHLTANACQLNGDIDEKYETQYQARCKNILQQQQQEQQNNFIMMEELKPSQQNISIPQLRKTPTWTSGLADLGISCYTK